MDQWMLDVTARLKNIEALCCGGKPAAAGHASGGVPVAAAAAAPSANGGGAKPRPVVEWEALMSGPVADFRAKGTSIGGRVGEATEIVYECFSKEGEIVAAICACRSPEQDMDSMQALVKPVGDLMMKVRAPPTWPAASTPSTRKHAPLTTHTYTQCGRGSYARRRLVALTMWG